MEDPANLATDPKPRHTERTYVPGQKEQALTHMAATSSRLAAETTGIPSGTIRAWASTPEGRALVESLRKQFSGLVAQNAQAVFEEATAKARERLEIGDARQTASGGIIFLPVLARDCAVIAGIYFDKWEKATTLMLTDGSASPVTPETDKRLEEYSTILLKELARRKLKESTVDAELVEPMAMPMADPHPMVEPGPSAPVSGGEALPQGEAGSDHRMSLRPPSLGDTPLPEPKLAKRGGVPVYKRDRKLRKDAGSRRPGMEKRGKNDPKRE